MKHHKIQKNNTRHHQIKSQDSDQQYEGQRVSIQQQQQNFKSQRTLRNKTKSTQYYEQPPLPQPQKIIQQQAELQYQTYNINILQNRQNDFLTAKIEALLWTRNNSQNEQELLIKYYGRSYKHCEWHLKKQLQNEGYELTSTMYKSLKLKMKKAQALKLKQQQYFNPNFLLPDRILSSTEIFSAIHHRKANQIKGKWQESIMLVCSKLLNFVKQFYPFGVLLHQPYNKQLQNLNGVNQSINLGQILNRIHLGYYKTNNQFWLDLGYALRLFEQIYSTEQYIETDYHRISITMIQCSIFLYEQWYRLMKNVHYKIKNIMIDNGLLSSSLSFYSNNNNIHNNNQQYEQEIQYNNILQKNKQQLKQFQMLNVGNFCKQNIFLNQKQIQQPKNQKQLEQLNPGIMNYAWLEGGQGTGQKYITHNYEEITIDDMKLLDLNVEIDKLYLVKWKDLSYEFITWQSEKNINDIIKIEQFRNWNKIPDKQTRNKFEMNYKIHKFLLQNSIQNRNKPRSTNITKMYQMLFNYGKKQIILKQYNNKDITVYKNYKLLKIFQMQSLNWLIKSWRENRNTILADEMGLGKTIQIIAFLLHLYTYQKMTGPFLVLAPLTTLPQWRKEIQDWTDLNCLLYYDQGAGRIRSIIQNYQFFKMHTTKSGDIIPSKIPKFQILLTNYQLFVTDFQILKKIAFQHMIFDQAHRLKNKNSITTLKLKQLPCSRMTLLTGTPIQNNTKQLWTLLNFIEPKHFPSQLHFQQQYGNLNTQQQVLSFKKMLKPYLLRRVKQDVQKSIPKLSQIIIDVEMTGIQKRVYRGILERNKNSMVQGLSTANFNSLAIQLRKCCNHPYLISQQLQQELKIDCQTQLQQMQYLVKSSGKIQLLMMLLKKFKLENKKVLLFSQFVMLLDMVKPLLEYYGFICQILKGSLSGTSRHQAITRFNQQENKTDVFLISTKAGGVGINLILATEIIIFDSDWNPQNDIQATARAHRIGQKKQVTVYRLITSHTYQSEMFQISSKKLGLDKAVFTGDCFKSTNKQFDDTQKQMSKQEIQLLLKKGVLGFLENEKKQDEYFAQSIQDILEKNARKVQYSITENSCAFSKTKFISEQSATKINVDAPDFWQVALKGIETTMDKFIKKMDKIKQYKQLQKQQQLMIETYNIVYQFVKNRDLGSSYNAQDERKLNKFLNKIANERNFNRKLREIANNLLEEIQKPKRNFKVKIDQILMVKNQIPIIQEIQHQSLDLSKSQGRITRNSRNNKQNKQQSQESQIINTQEKQLDQSNVQQEEEQSDNQSQSEEKEIPKNQKYQNRYCQEKIMSNCVDFQKLCRRCLKPKCTMFCRGFCGGAYHKKCWQLMMCNDNSQIPLVQIQEVSMSKDMLSKRADMSKKCELCLKSKPQIQCYICGKLGKCMKQTNKDKKNSRSYDPLTVYRCSYTQSKCDKFYHVLCLQEGQFKNKLADSIGKPLKEKFQYTGVFRCPVHYCFACYNTKNQHNKSKPLNCVQCAKSFHERCMKSENFIRLRSQNYICRQHINDDEQLKKIQDQYRLFDQQDRHFGKKLKKQNKKKQKQQQQENKNYKKNKINIENNVNKQIFKQKQKEKQKEIIKRKQKQKQKNKEIIKEKQKEKNKNKEGEKNKDKDKEKQKYKQKQKQKQKSKQKRNQSKNNHSQKLKESYKIKKQTNGNENEKNTDKNGSQLRQIRNLNYKDFDITPLELYNYNLNEKKDWCRYCGTRYSRSFKQSPWGLRGLCSQHHADWINKKIDLTAYMDKQLMDPINRNALFQLKILNNFAQSHPQVQYNEIPILLRQKCKKKLNS